MLFKLIDRSIASLLNPNQPGVFGIEFKSDPSNEEFLNRSVLEVAESTLRRLARSYCALDPDHRAMHWCLFCRAICISFQSEEVDKALVTASEVVEDETMGAIASMNEPSSPLTVTGLLLTHRQYASWCRNQALLKSKGLQFARSRLKCIALACATEAISELMNGNVSVHSDVAASRLAIESSLTLLAGDDATHTDEVALHKLPCYAGMFLEDMVTLCCTCASYTLDDVQLRSLQQGAIDCLASIVLFFKQSADPEAPGQLILSQFISQIISAVRPCLNISFTPLLLYSAGSLVCILIHHRFLEDKVLLKRLMKLMVASITDKTLASSVDSTPANQALEDSAINEVSVQLQVADEYTVADRIVTLGLSGRLFLIGLFGGGYIAPENGVCATLLDCFQSRREAFFSEWFEAVYFGVLFVHCSLGQLDASEIDFPSEGSLFFEGILNSSLVKRNLIATLPYTIVACICSQALTCSPSQLAFLLTSLTSSISQSGLHKSLSSADIINLKFYSLLGLNHILLHERAHEAISSSAWIPILRRLLGTFRRNSFSSLEKQQYTLMLLQLVQRLSLHYSDDFTNQMPSHEWVWLLLLNVYSDLFPSAITAGFDEDTGICHSLFPKLIPRVESEPLDSFSSNLDPSTLNNRLELSSKLIELIIDFARRVICFREYGILLSLNALYHLPSILKDGILQEVKTTGYVSSSMESIASLATSDPKLCASLQETLISDILSWHDDGLQKAKGRSPVGTPKYNRELSSLILRLWCALDTTVHCALFTV